MIFPQNPNTREQYIPQSKRKILPSNAPASPSATPLTWRVLQYVDNEGASYEPLLADISTSSDFAYHVQAHKGYISDSDHAQYTHKFYTARIIAQQSGPIPIQIHWPKNLSIVTEIGGVTTVEYTTGTDDNVATSFAAELSVGVNDFHILTYAGVADQRLEIALDLASYHSSATPISSGIGAGVARAAILNWDFKMVDIDNYATPMPGLTVSVTISQDGSAFNALAGSPAVSEIGFGWYTISVAAADMDFDRVILRATASGAAQHDRSIYTGVI